MSKERAIKKNWLWLGVDRDGGLFLYHARPTWNAPDGRYYGDVMLGVPCVDARKLLKQAPMAGRLYRLKCQVEIACDKD